MQLSQTKFIKIDGVNVIATVNTADEAKTAVKELRHKKRELTHVKRALQRQKKSAEAAAARARKARNTRQSPFDKMRSAFAYLKNLARSRDHVEPTMDVASLEHEIARINETQHNIDTVLLQLQGKLIHHA